MTYKEAERAIVKAVCGWLAEQAYLQNFRVDTAERLDRIIVQLTGGGFWGLVELDVVRFMDHPDEAEILDELNYAGDKLKAKVARTRDPNRLPG